MEKNKTICLAYFIDNKFIGWYGDSFGTIVQKSPKIYTYSENQIEIIRKNFINNIKKIKGSSFGYMRP